MIFFRKLKNRVADNRDDIGNITRSLASVHEELDDLMDMFTALIKAIDYISGNADARTVAHMRSSQISENREECLRYFVMLKSAIERIANKQK